MLDLRCVEFKGIFFVEDLFWWAVVGRAVASDTRDPRFKSRYRLNFIYQLYDRKYENKVKEAGMANL